MIYAEYPGHATQAKVSLLGTWPEAADRMPNRRDLAYISKF